MKPFKHLALGLALATGFLCTNARSETLNFSYMGHQDSIRFDAIGIGSFTFPDGLTHVGLSDLTSFTYTDLEVFANEFPTGPNPPDTFSFIYSFGAANLQDFSLTLAGGMPTNFMLITIPQPDNYADGSLRVPGVDPAAPRGGVNTPPNDWFATDGGATGVLVFSNAFPSGLPTPEPSSLVLMGAGIVGLAFERRRRNKA